MVKFFSKYRPIVILFHIQPECEGCSQEERGTLFQRNLRLFNEFTKFAPLKI